MIVSGTFKLIAPIYTVPAGATGQLKQLDSYHVALIFDHYEDFVFDIHDTDPEVWTAIKPHTVSPSLTDPPRSCRLAIAASLVAAFLTGWLFLPQPGVAQAAVEMIIEGFIF